MDASGPSLSSPLNAPSGAERGSGGPPALAGTVVGAKREGGTQTLEIQTSQGRIRFQAEGDFRVGDKVRLAFPGDGQVLVEKNPAPAEGAGDGPGVSYMLPPNLDALKDLRAFEETLARWMGAAPRTAHPGDPGGNRPSPDAGAFARLTLPQLMVQAMEREGGGDFLAGALSGMDAGVVSALLDTLEETAGDAAPKAALADLLRSLVRPGGNDSAPARARPEPPAGAFLPAEAGEGHAPWFGRIAERRPADGVLLAAGRTSYAGAGTAAPREPMFRYVLDMGGSNLEAFSPQARDPGEFSDFSLERQGGRLEVRFLDPAQSLPAGLRASLQAADPPTRQGMLLASRYLADFRREPYYGKLVEDFGAVLAQSGLLQPAAPGQPPAIPKQEQMDNLLKLFVSFPRDGQDPAGQAKAWGDAVKDPRAFLKLLKDVEPEQDGALLRPGTVLRLAARAEADPAALAPGPGAALGAAAAAAKEPGEGPEAAAWLRKLLPEAFRSGDLLSLAKDAGPVPGKEHEAAKFLLQAVASSLPQEAPVPEGQPTQFYYYQGQEWRNLQVTWRRDGGGKDARGRSGPKGPLQVSVETQSKHMGRVNVGVAWEPKGARLDFKNQYQDVRELLARSLPELEKSLALLDFKVSSWTYELLPDAPPPVSGASPPGAPLPPGYGRPSGLLDLKG